MIKMVKNGQNRQKWSKSSKMVKIAKIGQGPFGNLPEILPFQRRHASLIQPVVFGADGSPTVYCEGRLCEYDHPVVAVEQDCRRLTEKRVLFEEGWAEKAQRLKGQCEHAGHEVGEGEEDDEDGGRVPPQLLLRAEDDEGDGVEDGAEDCNHAANYTSSDQMTLRDHLLT